MQQFLEAPRSAGNAAQALQKIQAHPFVRQQIATPSFDLQNCVSSFNGLAILLAHSYIQTVAHQQPAKLGDTCNHAGFFGQNLRACMLIRNAGMLIC